MNESAMNKTPIPPPGPPPDDSDDDFVVELGPADVPGAPGPIGRPDHELHVPAGPSTIPPEVPVVPSEAVLVRLWANYRWSALLVGLLVLLGGYMTVSYFAE